MWGEQVGWRTRVFRLNICVKHVLSRWVLYLRSEEILMSRNMLGVVAGVQVRSRSQAEGSLLYWGFRVETSVRMEHGKSYVNARICHEFEVWWHTQLWRN